MAVFTGATRALGILSFALVTGCGGRASSSGPDGNAAGGAASDGGNGAVSNAPSAGNGTDAGTVSSGDDGTPGSAGQNTLGEAAGGSARAGSPSSAGNAAGGASAAGAAGADSTRPEVTTACTRLCSQWIHGCSIWEFPPTCNTDCASDLAVQEGACTDLGLAMLSCMTATSGTTNNNLCHTVFIAGLSVCRAKVDAFRACTAGSGGTAPLPNICMRAGNPFPEGGCAENKYCLDDKSYTFRCADAPDGKSTCTCTVPSMSTSFTFDEPSNNVCLNHMAECVASVNPVP